MIHYSAKLDRAACAADDVGVRDSLTSNPDVATCARCRLLVDGPDPAPPGLPPIVDPELREAAERAGDLVRQIAAGAGGRRFNSGKLRYDLVTPIGFEALAAVGTFGAAKYGERNWERGLSPTACYASLLRHAQAWLLGEDLDPESRLPHLAHAAWNALAVVHLARTRPDLDDRPRFPPLNPAPPSA